MEGPRRTLFRLLRWSLVVASAVGLWFVGYYLGRDAGIDRGRDDGFASARNEGLEIGRGEGLRIAATNRRADQVYKETYEVGALLDERLAKRFEKSLPTDQDIQREGEALVDEILADVFPTSGATDVPDFSVRYLPEDRTLIVKALGSRHSGLGIYLKSRGDYFVWKRAEEEQARESSAPKVADLPHADR
jgi:hypothetical protein